MPEYDIADPNDPRTLVVPFIFVPHGHPPPSAWMAEHPGWARFPATMVPRGVVEEEGGSSWNMQIDFSEGTVRTDAPPLAADRSAGAATDGLSAHAGTGKRRPPPVGTFDGTIASELAAWHDAQAVCSDPMSAAEILRTNAGYGPAQDAMGGVDPEQRNGNEVSRIQPAQAISMPRSAAPGPATENGRITLAAAGDLKCDGFSGGCQSGGNRGATGMYTITGRTVCADCAVKMLGIENEPAAEKVIILRPFIRPGN